MSYATKLKRALTERGMTQSELARKARVSASQMSLYVSGDSHPRPEAALRICEALEIAPEELHDEVPTVRDTSDRNFPVAEAAKLLGISTLTLRLALRNGVVDFGFAVKGSGDEYIYHISPKKLHEYIG